jgi:hypothetical protein
MPRRIREQRERPQTLETWFWGSFCIARAVRTLRTAAGDGDVRRGYLPYFTTQYYGVLFALHVLYVLYVRQQEMVTSDVDIYRT